MTVPDQDVASRAADTIELLTKLGGVLALLWGFIAKVYKPLYVWRRDHQARIIREILAPELQELREIREYENGCANRMELLLTQMRELFGDHDNLVVIAMDNRERLDETNELLDELGLSSDRRHPDRVQRITEMVTALEQARIRRRRATDPIPTPPPFPKHERPA